VTGREKDEALADLVVVLVWLAALALTWQWLEPPKPSPLSPTLGPVPAVGGFLRMHVDGGGLVPLGLTPLPRDRPGPLRRPPWKPHRLVHGLDQPVGYVSEGPF